MIEFTSYQRLIATVMKCDRESFEGADIRLTVPNEASGITLPYTKHSGHCGVPGDYIQVPIDFLTYYDEANKGILYIG